jgi:hypothetical protein
MRQYNQFISLMDNWDSVIDNTEMAKESGGELAKQQDIWAKSAEGAAQRVQ